MSIYADHEHSPIFKWHRKIENKTTKDMLLLKPKQEITISFPYTLKKESTYFDGSSEHEIKNKNKPYFIHYEYIAKAEHVKSLLKPSLIDAIKTMGYELYPNKIISNKVPLRLQ